MSSSAASSSVFGSGVEKKKFKPRFEAELRPFKPERIIICIDIDEEMKEQNISLSHRRKRYGHRSRIYHLRRLLRNFLVVKNAMNSLHEFALCAIGEEAIWLVDFTNDLQVLVDNLFSLEPQGSFSKFDISSLFDIINSKVTVGSSSTERGYYYRCILFYGRSSITPEYGNQHTKAWKQLSSLPNFFFDVLYVHDKASKENKPQEVFDFFASLESTSASGSYMFTESHSLKKLSCKVAQLVSNSSQRPRQSNWVTSCAPLD